MKTLAVLLLLAVALGAGYWTVERPGEGLEALGDQVVASAASLGTAARERAGPATERPFASAPEARPTAYGDAADEAGSQATAEALDSRVAALENELTRTMTASESSVVQSRLDDAERRLAATETRLRDAPRGPATAGTGGAESETFPAGALDRLEAVAGRLALLDRRLDENDAGTAASLDGLDARLEALDRRLAGTTGDGAEARASLSNRVDALADAVGTLDARIGTLGGTFGGTFGGAADDAAGGSAGAAAGGTIADPADDRGMAAALDTTSLRVAGLGSGTRAGTASGRTDVATAADAPRTAARTDRGGPAGASASAMRGVDRRLAALERRRREDATGTGRLATLDTRLDDVLQRLEALGNRDARRDDAVDALEGSMQDLATRSDALSIDAVQGRVREQLATLAAEVGDGSEEAGTDARALADVLGSLRGRVAGLEARVRDLPAASPAAGDAQQTQSALAAQILALGRRIETLPNAPDPAVASGLADGLDAVRAKVDQLSSQGFVTQEELRARVAGKNVEYKIYFDNNSTEITDAAATVLESFIVQESNRTSGVSIFGFTDTQGSATYNQQLAQRRAANVRGYLIRNGFDYTKIDNVAGLGEDAATAILDDGQEDAGQRVVVLFAAQI